VCVEIILVIKNHIKDTRMVTFVIIYMGLLRLLVCI
jgi:hypothetical protein